MEPEVSVPSKKSGKKNILIISLAIFTLLMLAASTQLLYMVLKNDKVYKGIYINNLNVSGLSKNELKAKLDKEFQDKIKDKEITIRTKTVSSKTSYAELKVSYDIDKAIADAYGLGRNGNLFVRLYDIFNAGSRGRHYSMLLSYDKIKTAAIIDDFYTKTLINVKEADILVQSDKVTLRSGHHGENIDKEELSLKITQMINERRDGVIEVTPTITAPTKLNIDDLYTQINKAPVDAVFKDENGTTSIQPHVVGMKLEKEKLTSIVEDLEKTENAEKVLPVEFTLPEITTEKANSMLFKDKLAYMSTHFSTGNKNDRNRGENIKIAIAKINGLILLPGQIFSFNDTVGPRTADDGYQLAHTYSAGKVVDGIGGGICQVSSTLYGAVLKSDLEVLVRRNHMFTVGYVPYGQDATVSYGTQDFKFKNSTKWPIKIEAGVTDKNYVYFTFIGTNENPNKKVVISQQILKTIPYTTKYINDPTMLEGTTKVKQEGKEGYIVDTFKTIKIDGKVVSQVKLHTSTYSPLVKEILKGTKKPAINTTTKATPQPSVSPTPTPTLSPTPTPALSDPTPTPVDDADNPPAAQ